ncbi:MAG: Gfo/Idh/MocA family oxidoreductase [Cytophagales bacterium]|nr:Gfo/Idh/MocA family oxidoreductase [Cytophagales bacterium]
MEINRKKNSIRSFLRKASLTSALVSSSPYLFSNSCKQDLQLQSRTYTYRRLSINDHINHALIGSGIQGIYDAISVQHRGVKLVAVCDLYSGRLDRAKELWGNDIFLTRDYRQILEREDADAVIAATSDHWHKKISVEALKAGKDVYSEKPMIQKFEEGVEFIS